MTKLLSDRWFKEKSENLNEESLNIIDEEINEDYQIEDNLDLENTSLEESEEANQDELTESDLID
jgi:deoxyadenosine/deoxycytidine kinase